MNQVGYPDAAKRACLMSSTAETGATFSVINSAGSTVYTAPIGANLGSWTASYPDVYALDFDSVTIPGTYSISVTGPVASTSPSFVVNTGENVYAVAIANALSFYQNERDGPNYIPSALRTAPAHLNDQTAMTYLTPSYNAGTGRFSGSLTPLGNTMDASGGWWDAGDYPKFVETTSYTVDLMLLLVRDFPTEAGALFSFGFPWDTYDTTSHGAGLSVMASEYDHLTGTTTYAAYASRWLGNILGANGWGLSFIVGDGAKFPDCLQHQVTNLVGSLNSTGTVLAGAAAEGPNSQATKGPGHRDDRLPRERRRHIRSVQLHDSGVQGQHAVLLQHRTRYRSHRRLTTGLRLADERAVITG